MNQLRPLLLTLGIAETGSGHRPARRGGGLFRFAVLVPHRDSRRLVEACRPALFAAGFHGAWSFPAAAPLARLNRPLTPPELKALAASLRQATLDNGQAGKITAGESAEEECPCFADDAGSAPHLRFWGPVLNLPVPGGPDGLPMGRAILCAALTPDGLPAAVPALPAVSFRAAAVANLTVKPLPQGAAGYSFRWRLGQLYWLPRP
ncbi:MAG: hypothetical protein LBL56_06240 [Treponema sp.]|jgi:hypothetical protein|nr:hypothetical protein [Treponema sp.]